MFVYVLPEPAEVILCVCGCLGLVAPHVCVGGGAVCVGGMS